MKDWVVRNLPLGTELSHYRGVEPGAQVAVVGWRFPGSIDYRVVRSITREQCQGGVMFHLEGGRLQNGSTSVSASWVRECGGGLT
jgi:hypothetical protein